MDFELCALSALGHALVLAGHIEEGLSLVDEARAGTLAGEGERYETTAFTCCEMARRLRRRR